MSKYFGLTTVSGLAKGIDKLVHENSIQKNLHTIAVLPLGIDHILPKENRFLAQNILDNEGLLVSEIKPHAKYSKWSFPRRNRIIAGLGDAVVIIEAPKLSGALITAKYAWQADIPVYVSLPGLEKKSIRGNYNLIDRERAHVITPSMNNLITDINLSVNLSKERRAELFSNQDFNNFQNLKKLKLSEQEKEILIIVKNGFNTISQIFEQIKLRNLKITFSKLNELVAKMQLNKVIKKDEYGNLTCI